VIPQGRAFYKMSGSGNDFVVVDARTTPPGRLAEREVVGRICAHGTGVGADGIVFVEPSSQAAVRLVYLNADASRAEFCGNATLCVTRLAVVDAPWGTPVEVATGLTRGSRPDTPLMPGGFLTRGEGFGHAVVGTTAFDESVRFATDGLGMVRSDYLEMEIAAGIELEVHFFHCNARHHTLALARVPFEMPTKLHHLMFEANERDDVGAAFDRAFAAGLPLPNGLGLHDNDRMFSFYVESPAGFQVEVGHGARQITEPWTDDRRYDRISAWGHQPVVHPPSS